MNRKKIVTLETKLQKARDKDLRSILKELPRKVSFIQMKFAFIEHVIEANNGNLTAASRELDVSYRTLMSWVEKFREEG